MQFSDANVKPSLGRSKLPSLQQGASKKSQTSMTENTVYKHQVKKRKTMAHSNPRPRKIKEVTRPTNVLFLSYPYRLIYQRRLGLVLNKPS